MKFLLTTRPVILRLCALLVAAWVLGAASLYLPPAAHALTTGAATRPTEVTVVDSAGILNSAEVQESVSKIEYPREISIVVLAAATGSREDRALNDYVRDQALGEHPEWRSTSNPDKFREGLLILAVDPVARINGAYMGEDLHLEGDSLTTVLDSAKPAFRENRWSDGMIDAARVAADVYADGAIGDGNLSADGVYTPRQKTFFEANHAVIVGGGAAAVVGGGAGTIIALVSRRRTSEATRLLREAEATYSDLSFRLGEMDVNANTLPESSAVAMQVRDDVRRFDTVYRQATQRVSELAGLRKNDKLPGKYLQEVRDLCTITEAAAGLEKRVDATNDILNQVPGWQNSWLDQCRDLVESADQVEALIGKSRATAASPTAQYLRSAAVELTQGVHNLPNLVERRQLAPDAALVQLRDLATKFQQAQNSHVGVMMEQVSRNAAGRERARSAMSGRTTWSYGGGYFGGYNYGGGVMTAGSQFTPTAALITGYTVASAAARQSSSGSGSSGGFSGGGSFSGSGGSSRF
ncbi:DUF5129 domain-containing protein [Micrococcales bacterium 31B]|nr:DUF5129 domain-containing protein [Micrococcales bacterium 31B]